MDRVSGFNVLGQNPSGGIHPHAPERGTRSKFQRSERERCEAEMSRELISLNRTLFVTISKRQTPTEIGTAEGEELGCRFLQRAGRGEGALGIHSLLLRKRVSRIRCVERKRTRGQNRGPLNGRGIFLIPKSAERRPSIRAKML